MSRPIPVEVVSSHVHLSQAHHEALFGERHSGTVRQELSQTGQFAYEEMVEVIGPNGKSITLRVLGPSRKSTQVEITKTESELLGFDAPETISGNLVNAADCTIQTALTSINVPSSVIIPCAHLHLSDSEAREARVDHGSMVRVDVVGEGARIIERVIVRVHPTYRARLHMNPDDAREHWIHSGTHVRIRDIHH